MKSISTPLFLIVLSCCAFAQTKEITFKRDNIPTLLKQAKENNSLIFIDVTATWCKPCKEMEKTIFNDSLVSSFFNTKFLSKKIYLDTDSIYPDSISKEIKAKTSGVPRFFFLDKDGKTIYVDGGLKTKNEFIKMGESALKNELVQKRIAELSGTYPTKKTDKLFLLQYMKLRKQADLDNSKIVEDYLQCLSQNELLSDSTIHIIIENESNIHGKGYTILADEQCRAKILSKSTDSLISYKMYKASLDIIRKDCHKAIVTKNRELMDECLKENMRVMQDKGQAQKMNEWLLKKIAEQ